MLHCLYACALGFAYKETTKLFQSDSIVNIKYQVIQWYLQGVKHCHGWSSPNQLLKITFFVDAPGYTGSGEEVCKVYK